MHNCDKTALKVGSNALITRKDTPFHGHVGEIIKIDGYDLHVRIPYGGTAVFIHVYPTEIDLIGSIH
jgi:ribosomal protein L21E